MDHAAETFGLQFNPNQSKLFRTIPDQSEPIRKTFWIRLDENPLEVSPISSDSARDIDSNGS